LKPLRSQKAIQPFAQRRLKFIAALDKQLAGVPDDGTSTITSTWVWKSDEGDWFISPCYGRTPLELAPGLNAIKCADVADVAMNLQKLKALADEGKLDDVLMEAATTIRSRFGK
tara:strand:+ start:1439 stop:1780 length:342 start_codon:yes stop_codon:yes gene_type:complete